MPAIFHANPDYKLICDVLCDGIAEYLDFEEDWDMQSPSFIVTAGTRKFKVIVEPVEDN